jgi:hypothetical protein
MTGLKACYREPRGSLYILSYQPPRHVYKDLVLLSERQLHPGSTHMPLSSRPLSLTLSLLLRLVLRPYVDSCPDSLFSSFLPKADT